MPPRFRLMAGKFRLSLTLPVPLVVALCVAPQDEILAAWRLTGWVTLPDSILYEDGSVGGVTIKTCRVLAEYRSQTPQRPKHADPTDTRRVLNES